MPDMPETHKHIASKAPKHISPDDKNLTYARQTKRALATNSSTWMKIRAMVLRQEPLCRTCNAKGLTVVAKHVDHIDGNASTHESNRIENLQPLCISCHNSKTATEMNKIPNHMKPKLTLCL